MKIKQISTLFIVLFLTLTNCKKEDENISEPDPNATISEVRFYTNKGDFVVELEDKLAPITSSNFLKLVNEKFYDGIIFHRVLQNFIIQGGDPTGTGSGGPGYSIQDEFHEDLSNIEKTISMANSGPNTGGSQFFFNMKDNTFLDYNESPSTSKHAVFGKVISGYSIVQTISNVSVNSQDRPLTDVVIDSIRKIN
ncbi:MAG: cyclophilin family peptidyl-prolyl cis-trans isomerase [Urechidicola sp.]|jgi:peptidylprolyl isomerase/peptidyl-prolyl cis-trans isomerase A (cyclophilin A)|tara:strand:- start:1240 stop:1824 length:585 start_codon:yes stop_codon:yes gene_type:complete